MDKPGLPNVKNVNQAWRKQPRKFAPKSRLGCRTCKIRRIKCGLEKPSCLKCRSTGRSCDGYAESSCDPITEQDTSFAKKYTKDATRRIWDQADYQHCPTTIDESAIRCRRKDNHVPVVWDLGPLMILSATGPTQDGALSFFEHIAINHLTEYHHNTSWKTSLMFFSQTSPSVRCATTALALIHQQYANQDARGPVRTPISGHLQVKEIALTYYNKAIQLLLGDQHSDSTQTMAVTLLVCYLFTCFDHLAGNHTQAVRHLHGGVQLIRNLQQDMDNNHHGLGDKFPPLIRQVSRQIRRLDMQAVLFLVDWTPAALEEDLTPQIHHLQNAYQSLEQAAEQMSDLISRVMILRNAGQQAAIANRQVQAPLMPEVGLRTQLKAWFVRWEKTLQQRTGNAALKTTSLISMTLVQYAMAEILLNTHGAGREMDYDLYLPRFEECLALVEEIMAMRENHSGWSAPTFTPEIGILPVLHIIGVKCRHPLVRRKARDILRQRRLREAVWDSVSTVAIIQRVIEIEEGGSGQVTTVVDMESIGIWQRVETISWVHVVSEYDAGRLDVTYQFCGQEEVHEESLPL